MDGFKSIEIKNFRGIDHLLIEDCSRVNVFLGQNNSGKTTVLESMAMLMSMSNPDIPQAINAVRARKPFSKFIDIQYYFNNLDVITPPEVKAEQTDGNSRHLKLALSYVFDELADPQNEPQQQMGTVKYVNTLEMNFEVSNGTSKQSYQSWLRVNSQGLVVNRKVADGYLENKRAWLTPSDLMTSNLANDLAELFKRNRKDAILALLKLFDLRINGIEILTDDIYVGFEGVAQMLSLSMMGDGLRRYLNIVAAAANPLTNILLIDEIDNGLHYSVYKKLWQSLFALASATDKQIFVSTHSKETLYYLNEMLQEAPAYKPDMRLYTLERTIKKGMQAYMLTHEGLKGACENDIELRSIAL
ncbi:MAG: AAA family ATPase [Bacteroidaceae bacterium]|nr:AAA family ATPase [Bacteroidaceae bacterium]